MKKSLFNIFAAGLSLFGIASAGQVFGFGHEKNNTEAGLLAASRVSACPKPTISSNGPLSFCTGGSVTLSAPLSGVRSSELVAARGKVLNPGGMVFDGMGNMYVANTGRNQITKITPGGAVLNFAGNGISLSGDGNAGTAGFNNPAGIAIDAAGNIYVADRLGNTIRKISPAGVTVTLAGSGLAGSADGAGTAASFNKPADLALDASGNIYVSDSGNNAIRKISPTGNVSSLAGNSGLSGSADGPGALATFNMPAGIVADAAGNIYVADMGNNSIRKILPNGNVSTLAGGTLGSADGTGSAASFRAPADLVIDGAGNIYATDKVNGRIRKITPSGDVSTITSTFFAQGSSTDEAYFANPNTLATDSEGNLFIASDNSLISKLSINEVIDAYIWNTGETGQSITAAVTGSYTVQTVSAGCTSVPGDAIEVSVNASPARPTVTSDHTTDMCTSDFTSVQLTASPAAAYLWNTGETTQSITASETGIYSVQAVAGACSSLPSKAVKVFIRNPIAQTITAQGQTEFCGGGMVTLEAVAVTPDAPRASELAGNGTPGHFDGTGNAAQFGNATGVASDVYGNLYVIEHGSPEAGVRKVSPAGAVSTIHGYTDNGTVKTPFGFSNAFGIALDTAGNIYISDSDRICKMTQAGLVTILAGGTTGYSDGIGTNARFNGPAGIALDDSANVYVADSRNNRIRKVTAAGRVTTIAGSLAGNLDGYAPSARFNNPEYVAIDAGKNIYVSDGNNSVRKIYYWGYVSTIYNFGFPYSRPRGLTIDSLSNVYVAHSGSASIFKILPSNITTLFARGASGAGTPDVIANLVAPAGLAMDALGNMYVTDTLTNTLVKIRAGSADKFQWSNGEITRTINVTAGNSYTVQAVAGRCSSALSDPLIVTVNTVPVPGMSASGPIWFCEPTGNTVTLSSTEQYGNRWNTGDTTQSILVTTGGYYSVSTFSMGCQSQYAPFLYVNMGPPPKPVIYSNTGSFTACEGIGLTLIATNGEGNIWNNGETSQVITVNVSGKYAVQTIINGCSSEVSDTIVVTIIPAPQTPAVTASGPTTFCSGGTVTLTSSITDGNVWSTGENTQSITVSVSGSYFVRQFDGTCYSTLSDPINVSVTSAPAPWIYTANSAVICNGQPVDIYSNYTTGNIWSTGDTTWYITVSTPGSYYARRVTESCTSEISPVVVINAVTPVAPTITVMGSTTMCSGVTVNLVASQSEAYFWNTGETTPSINVSATGTYSVMSYTSGCPSPFSDAVSILVRDLPAAAGAIAGLPTPVRNTSETYRIDAIPNAESVDWTYSGSDVSLSPNGNEVTLTFGPSATSGRLVVTGISSCGSGQSNFVELLVQSAPLQDLVISTDQSISGEYRNITVTGSPTVTLNGNLFVAGAMSIPTGATLVTACYTITGPGTFSLEDGGKILICDPAGIEAAGPLGAVQTAVRNFSTLAEYVYNGTASQLTGSGLPQSVVNLTINNLSGVALIGASGVTNTLNVVTGDFNMNNKPFTLYSTAARTARLEQVNAGAFITNATAFTAQRWLDPAAIRNDAEGFGAYYMLGSQVVGVNVDSWNTAANPYLASTYVSAAPGGSVYLYANNASGDGWFKPDNAAVPMPAGKAAKVWFGNDFFTNGATASLTGPPVTGDFTLPVSYCTAGCADNLVPNGWNLVANPYPSAIDWDNAAWTKTDIAAPIYVYRHNQGVYSVYVGGIGLNSGSNLIASGQGFIVRATAATALLKAAEAVKTDASAAILRTNALSMLRLKVETADRSDETVIAERPGSTRAFELEYDAEKFMNPGINIWSEPSGPTNRQAIANLVPAIGDTIALRLRSSTAATLTLSATEMSDWADRFGFIVRDDITGTDMPFTAATRLTFSLNAGQTYPLTLKLRSPLAISPRAALSLNVSPNPNRGSFTITAGSEIKALSVFDNLGRLVYTKTTSGNTSEALSLNLPAGIYTAKVYVAGGIGVKQIVIE
ncbi:MAG: T9SS type A sorting domain-containing protein [Bacteroidota bacterium]